MKGNISKIRYTRPDWNQTDETKPDFIKNKPNIAYKYHTVSTNDFFRIVEVMPNTVTYVSGEPPESGEIEFNFMSDANETTNEEFVIILNFYDLIAVPTIKFNANIRWLNDETPEIVVGKEYMFSFVKAKSGGGLVYHYIGIGGEFA